MATSKVPSIEEFVQSKKLEVSKQYSSNEFALQSLDINLKKLLVQVTGQTDTVNISRVKIKVVTKDAGLHRLADYTPRLKILVLDGSCVYSLRDLGSSLKSLETLSLVRCGLKSLDGVSGFRSLITLIARDNYIKNPSPCSLIHKLRRLDLADNQIHDLTSFAFLRNCKHLRILDVAGNLFDNYKNTIVSFLPQIQVLDGEDTKGVEISLRAVDDEEDICENESDPTSEDEDLIICSENEDDDSLPAKKSKEKWFSFKTDRSKSCDESSYQEITKKKLSGAGDVETCDSRAKEDYEEIISKDNEKRDEERSLDSSSSSIHLLTHEFHRISMQGIDAMKNDEKHCHSLESITNKLSSGRAVCGNLAASLRARNATKNPFTLSNVRVGTGAKDNNDTKINMTLVYNSIPESVGVREMD